MPTDPAFPLYRADENVGAAISLLENDADLTPGIRQALGYARVARTQLAAYKLPPYEPEHARPEPVTVGARRALESIRDMTSDHDVSRAVGVMERIYEAAVRGLESIEQAGPLAPAQWSSGINAAMIAAPYRRR